VETEVGGVKVDGGLYIVDKVADAGVTAREWSRLDLLRVGGGEDGQQMSNAGVDTGGGSW
jgi:hypothetical protein